MKFKEILPITAGLLAFAVLPAAAAVIPAELPPVDLKAPVSKKPVKVYIQSGQSNSFGMGEVDPKGPIYSKVFLSADPSVKTCALPIAKTALVKFGVYQSAAADAPAGATASIYKGVYDSKTDYSKAKPAKQESVALGQTDAQLPGIDGPHTVLVNAFIEVPYAGNYELHAGFEASARCIATLDGKEAYRKDSDAASVITKLTLKAKQRYPLSITYQQGGSAALWLEKVDLEPMGDLHWVVEKLGKFTSLMGKDGKWVARTDAVLNDAYMGKGQSDPLGAVACGSTFGPELGFGWVMATFHDEPIMVIKADIGNRSLGWDILPPGSERYTFEGKEYPGYGERVAADGSITKPGPKDWYAGKQYDDYTASIHAVLDNFGERYPQYKDQGFEVAGFVWWQGHKDSGEPAYRARYETNLANLIKAWRKEFKAPKANWAIATVGFHGKDMPEQFIPIAEAQLAVADPAKHPEFVGNVKTIDTRPFWRAVEVSPMDQDYHYNHNAETYMLVGDALGRAMVEMEGGKVEYPSGEMDPSVSAVPYMKEISAEELAPMSKALSPIILGKIIPEYVVTAPGTPGYRRHGLPIEMILENKTPAKPPAELESQLDEMINFYDMAGIHDYDWKRFGPEMQKAEWQYLSFDPKEKPVMDSKGKPEDMYRKITLPAGSENWTTADFDSAKAGWKIGKAPFGQNNGKLKALREHCNNPQCGCDVTPNTLWEKEVILMRQTFEVPKFEKDKRYRIIVGGGGHTWAGEGYALYVNGKMISEAKGGFYKNGGGPRGGYIFSDVQDEIGSGKVTIAVKAFLRQTGHKGQVLPPSGHLSVWMEEAKLPAAAQEIVVKPAK